MWRRFGTTSAIAVPRWNPDYDDPKWPDAKAIHATLYYTGMRIGELGHLTRKDVSVHPFRHTHISHALNRWGRNPSIVQRRVGHRDLATTQRYLHVGIEDLVREAGKVGE